MATTLFFHVDVNSAYLSWEAAYRLSLGAKLDLRTLPAVVGGDPKTRRGIVLAKSIPAKAYHIQTGETLHAAFEKCPHLQVVPPNYHLYMKASNAFNSLLEEYSPHLQRFSVDETFMDMSHHPEDYLALAHEIKDRIAKELGFTVNIGIGPNKLLAKVASDFKKPNQVHTLFHHELAKKMWPLPVGDLFMVGRATEDKLRKMGIFTIGDLATSDVNYLRHKLKSHGQLVWEYARGQESSAIRVDQIDQIKGIGNSSTLRRDIHQIKDAFLYLLALTEMVAMRLRNAKKMAWVVVVSIKSTSFERYSHQRTLFSPTDSTNRLYQEVKALFLSAWKGEAIRHLGVRVTGLVDNETYQYSLFDDQNLDKERRIDQTIDELRLRFGKNTITRSAFLHQGIKPIIGGVGEEEYQMMSSLL